MKTNRIILAMMLMAIFCTQVAAQGFRIENFPEGSYSPVTNVNRNSYPRVLSDNSVMFRVNAPQAQKVQIDLCGIKYDMQKSDDGVWMVTSKPQVPDIDWSTGTVDFTTDVLHASEFEDRSHWTTSDNSSTFWGWF